MEEWFAIRVRSNFEWMAARALRGRGYEEYLPVYRRKRYGARGKTTERPLFPGYVFGRFEMNRRGPILMIPGVLNILTIGKIPAPVDPAELAAVRAMVESGIGAEPFPFLRAGQSLRIAKGPLSGLEGTVIQLKKNWRLVVSITLLQRSISVEIDRDWIDSPA
jgi:transcription termination/antitermination protein NusG